MEKTKIFFAACLVLAMLCTGVRASFLDSLPVVWQLSDFQDSPLSVAPMCQIANGNPLTDANNWLAPSFVAFALMVGLIGLVYVLSGLQGGVSQAGIFGPGGGTFFFATQLTGTKLRAWCKEALFGVLTTGIIIGVLSGAYVGMKGFGLNYINVAIGYAHTMRNTLVIDFGILTTFSMVVSFLSQAPSFAVWGFGIRFSLVPVLKPVFDMLGIILNMSIASLGEWFAQEFFLCFIKRNMLAIFLPMSLFLRAFTPTKALGNTVLAIAIGFFFVYPFLISLNENIVSDKYGAPVVINVDGTKGMVCDVSRLHVCVYWTGLWDVLKRGAADTLAPWNEMHNASAPAWFFISLIGFVLFKFAGILGAPMLVFVISTIPMLLESIAYFVFIVSIIMPVFNIFVTITITMELAKVLGTEMDLSAIEKLL